MAKLISGAKVITLIPAVYRKRLIFIKTMRDPVSKRVVETIEMAGIVCGARHLQREKRD